MIRASIRSVGLTSLAALILALCGCNTVDGMGDDAESAEDAVEDEAEERN